MHSNLWLAGTISGGCAVRYTGLRSGGYKQGSNEGHEEKDSGTHEGILVAITPEVSERFCCDSTGGVATAMFAFFNRVADAFGISPQGYL